MANELTCGWYLEKFSLLYDYYAFFDTKDYLADSLFIKHKVHVHFMEEYAHPDAEYRVIFCKCRKRDSEAFRAALDELTDKMLICGHRDYPEFSRQMKQIIGIDRKQIYMEEREDRGAVDTVEKAEQESAERVLSKQRGSWNGLCPVTRTVPNRKAYDRNRVKEADRKNEGGAV